MDKLSKILGLCEDLVDDVIDRSNAKTYDLVKYNELFAHAVKQKEEFPQIIKSVVRINYNKEKRLYRIEQVFKDSNNAPIFTNNRKTSVLGVILTTERIDHELSKLMEGNLEKQFEIDMV